MRIGLSLLALLMGACGARVDDNHTGGKTSWLSACSAAADCAALQGAVCEMGLCTKPCESSCDIERTSCTALFSSADERDAAEHACLPVCASDSECAGFGSHYDCVGGICSRRGSGATAPLIIWDSGGTDAGSLDPGQSPPQAETTTGEGDASAESANAPPSRLKPDGGAPNDVDPYANDAAISGSDFVANPYEDAGPNTAVPPNPHGCPSTIDSPSERPYLPALEAESLTFINGEPACEGPCGYRYQDEAWRFDSALECPLLSASDCEELRQALAALPASCGTVDDCTRYIGSLNECEPTFLSYAYFDSTLTGSDDISRAQLRKQANSGGCGAVNTEAFGGYPECIDGVCALPIEPASCE